MLGCSLFVMNFIHHLIIVIHYLEAHFRAQTLNSLLSAMVVMVMALGGGGGGDGSRRRPVRVVFMADRSDQTLVGMNTCQNEGSFGIENWMEMEMRQGDTRENEKNVFGELLTRSTCVLLSVENW